jgi:hypothetical protein
VSGCPETQSYTKHTPVYGRRKRVVTSVGGTCSDRLGLDPRSFSTMQQVVQWMKSSEEGIGLRPHATMVHSLYFANSVASVVLVEGLASTAAAGSTIHSCRLVACRHRPSGARSGQNRPWIEHALRERMACFWSAPCGRGGGGSVRREVRRDRDSKASKGISWPEAAAAQAAAMGGPSTK